MNIFYLDPRPDTAAEMHCDKHVVKMVLEYAQLLSTAHRVLDEDDAHPDLYKIAHKNHPSTIWTRSSKQHYDWLFRLFRMLSAEYSIRYGLITDSNDTFKVHKSWEKLGKILEVTPKNIVDNGWVDPPQCMPDSCKNDDVVTAYRNYYIQEKKSFAKWNYTRRPEWMLNLMKEDGVQIFINKKEMPYSHPNMVLAINSWLSYLTNDDLTELSEKCIMMLDHRQQKEHLSKLEAKNIPIQKNRHDT